jgi:diguanylate cyclase (GGDEF)-like protein
LKDKDISSRINLSPHLEKTAKLPTLPAVAARILHTLKKDGFSSKELAELIAMDPALTVKILSLANSSFYSTQGGIDNVYRAIDVLGVNVVRNLALSFCIIDSIKSDGAEGFDYTKFWQQSVIRAVSATAVAKFLNRHTDEVFIVGLLADIGKMLMSLVRPNDYLEVLREVRLTGVKDYEIERRIFSYSHEDIGSETLRNWGIPEIIYQPIGLHHKETSDSGKNSDIIRLIEIGDIVSDIYFNRTHPENMESLCAFMKDKYGVNADDTRSLVDAAAGVGSDILASFDIPSEQLRPYSQLLQEANEEMFRLNLTYDQLLRRYVDGQQKASQLAAELKEANRRLQELAVTDGLTGLYNYRYFHTELQKEIDRARRHMHCVSLVMLDMDDFKRVNDNYGHLSGDMVLQAVAGLIGESSRNVDTVARCGGDEFSLILPETDVKGAAVVAEKLRKAIEANSVVIESIKIRVTASLGMCIYDPQKGQINKDEFIKAADRALYNSKNSGQNRLSIVSL